MSGLGFVLLLQRWCIDGQGVELKPMRNHSVPEFLGDLGHELLDLTGPKFRDAAVGQIDQVIVRPIGRPLVAGLSAVEGVAPHEPVNFEKVQGSIHRGQRNAWMNGSNTPVQYLYLRMITGLYQHAHDHKTLARQSQANLATGAFDPA